MTPVLHSFSGGGFDPQLALALARASQDAYNPPIDADVVNCESDDIEVVLSEERGPAGIHSGPLTIVAFRGTVDVKNWLIDLDIKKVNRPPFPGEIHYGFWDALDSVASQLEFAIGGRDRLIFTGHSLGGALAILAAWIYRTRVEAVYTFGAPHTGTVQWRRGYNAILGNDTHCCVAPGDLVPCVPPFWHGYRGVARTMFLDPIEGPRFGLPRLHKLRCEMQANLHALANHKFTPLAAHAVSNYISLLTEANKGNKDFVPFVPFCSKSA